MPLLNYSTEIAATKSLAEIQARLGEHGARSVTILYDKLEPAGLSFTIETPIGVRSFRLPAHIDEIEEMLDDIPRAKKGRIQAARVGWRIIKDWVEAQCALIDAGMVSMDEVMLPYLETTPGGPVLYEAFVEQQLLLNP